MHCKWHNKKNGVILIIGTVKEIREAEAGALFQFGRPGKIFLKAIYDKEMQTPETYFTYSQEQVQNAQPIWCYKPVTTAAQEAEARGLQFKVFQSYKVSSRPKQLR